MVVCCFGKFSIRTVTGMMPKKSMEQPCKKGLSPLTPVILISHSMASINLPGIYMIRIESGPSILQLNHPAEISHLPKHIYVQNK
jgi:hypothetical protein